MVEQGGSSATRRSSQGTPGDQAAQPRTRSSTEAAERRRQGRCGALPPIGAATPLGPVSRSGGAATTCFRDLSLLEDYLPLGKVLIATGTFGDARQQACVAPSTNMRGIGPRRQQICVRPFTGMRGSRADSRGLFHRRPAFERGGGGGRRQPAVLAVRASTNMRSGPASRRALGGCPRTASEQPTLEPAACAGTPAGTVRSASSESARRGPRRLR